MGIDERTYDIEHRVIYVAGDQKLALMQPEKATVLEKNNEETYLPYKLGGASRLEIPNYAYMDHDIITDVETYFEMKKELRRENRNHVVLGKYLVIQTKSMMMSNWKQP